MGDGDRKNGPIHDNGLVEGKDAPPLDKYPKSVIIRKYRGLNRDTPKYIC